MSSRLDTARPICESREAEKTEVKEDGKRERT